MLPRTKLNKSQTDVNVLKLGHFAALVLFVLALGFGLAAYWDLQDGVFRDRSIYAPVFMGVMAITLFLFPGAPIAFNQAASDSDPNRVGNWVASAPPLHKKAWLAGLVLSLYAGSGVIDYLKGVEFFALGEQVKLVFVALIGYFGFRWYARRKGY